MAICELARLQLRKFLLFLLAFASCAAASDRKIRELQLADSFSDLLPALFSPLAARRLSCNQKKRAKT